MTNDKKIKLTKLYGMTDEGDLLELIPKEHVTLKTDAIHGLSSTVFLNSIQLYGSLSNVSVYPGRGHLLNESITRGLDDEVYRIKNIMDVTKGKGY